MSRELYPETVDIIRSALENYAHHLSWFEANEDLKKKYSRQVLIDILEEMKLVGRLLEQFKPGEYFQFNIIPEKHMVIITSALKQYKEDLLELQKDFKNRIPMSSLQFEKANEEIQKIDDVLDLLEKIKSAS